MMNSSPANLFHEKILLGLARVGQAITNRTNQEFRNGSYPMNTAQMMILRIVRKHHENGLNLKDLAAKIGVTSATASVSVGSLVGKGLLKKSWGGVDARSFQLFLTAKGRRELDRYDGFPEDLKRVVSRLSQEEQDILYQCLVKLVGFLQRENWVPVSSMCLQCRFFRPYAHQDPNQPHHCGFSNTLLGPADLQLECKEQIPADDERARKNWMIYLTRQDSTSHFSNHETKKGNLE